MWTPASLNSSELLSEHNILNDGSYYVDLSYITGFRKGPLLGARPIGRSKGSMMLTYRIANGVYVANDGQSICNNPYEQVEPAEIIDEYEEITDECEDEIDDNSVWKIYRDPITGRCFYE